MLNLPEERPGRKPPVNLGLVSVSGSHSIVDTVSGFLRRILQVEHAALSLHLSAETRFRQFKPESKRLRDPCNSSIISLSMALLKEPYHQNLNLLQRKSPCCQHSPKKLHRQHP